MACSSEGLGARGRFEPATPGVLTVATATIPAPAFWEGTADAPDGGIEAGIADAMADRFGLDRVVVVEVPFAEIAAGELGGADFALTQLTPTAELDRVLDFTTPYLDAPAGVMVRRGVEAIDADDLRDLRWVVVDVSTLTPRVVDEIRPRSGVATVSTRGEALDLLREDRADALLLDLPVAEGLAVAEPDAFEVVGQLLGSEGLAAVLPDGSDNLMAVDSAVRALIADGTVADLRAEAIPRTADDVHRVVGRDVAEAVAHAARAASASIVVVDVEPDDDQLIWRPSERESNVPVVLLVGHGEVRPSTVWLFDDGDGDANPHAAEVAARLAGGPARVQHTHGWPTELEPGDAVVVGLDADDDRSAVPTAVDGVLITAVFEPTEAEIDQPVPDTTRDGTAVT